MPLPSLRLLTLLLPLAVAFPLTGCQDTARSLLSNGGESSGGIAFRLDSAVLAQVGTSVDSLRLELRKGTLLRSVAVRVSDSVRVTDLEPGDWTLEAGLYDSARTLKWYGKTTVSIVSGTVAKAFLDLRAATGSVDVIIRLDSAGSTQDTALTGMWYFRAAGSKLVEPGRTDAFLYFGADGSLKRSDGCNTLAGRWLAKDSLLTMTVEAKPGTNDCDYLPTYGYATDYEIGNALDFGRFWKITGSNVLRLSDKEGKELGVLTRSPAPVLPANCRKVSDDEVVCDAVLASDRDSLARSKLLNGWMLESLGGTFAQAKSGFFLDDSGRFTWTVDCNGASGTWRIAGDTMSFLRNPTTRMGCLADTARDTFATAEQIGGVLSGTRFWSLDSTGRLHLLSSDHQELAVFVRLQLVCGTVPMPQVRRVLPVPLPLPETATDVRPLTVRLQDTSAMANYATPGYTLLDVKVLSATRSDSGVLMDLLKYDAGSEVVAFGFQSFKPSGICVDSTNGADGGCTPTGTSVMNLIVRSAPRAGLGGPAPDGVRVSVFVPFATTSYFSTQVGSGITLFRLLP